MKAEDQIILAHDMLDAVLRHEIEGLSFGHGPEEEKARAARDALCWVLEHVTQDEFQKNIDTVSKAVQDAGYTATRLQ